MAKGVNLSDIMSKTDLNEEIAKVAYELYEKRGKSDGFDFDDWIKAEKMVLGRYQKIGESKTEDFVKHVVKKTVKKRTRTKSE